MKSMCASNCPPITPADPALPSAAGVLIVDDDALFREATRRLLHAMRKELPLRIFDADSGRAATLALAKEDVDCVLLDYQMPGGSGLEWLQVIQASRPDMAVIMVTGAGDERIAVEAMKNGATDYLVKGAISPDALQRAILNALQRRKMAETIQKQQAELLEAERYRVMIESLGAACHHLGQPATVILAYLELMQRKESSPEIRTMLDDCRDAALSMAEILDKLRNVSAYRTVPYLPKRAGEPSRLDERILQIE